MVAEGVVLLHGHGRTGRSMRFLARKLQHAGYSTYAPDYNSFRDSVPAIVEQLSPGISEFQSGLTGPLHIVTHSLGGLVTRALLTAQRLDPLGRIVMLAPPHGGSEWADLLMRLRLDRLALGPVAPMLGCRRSVADEAVLGAVNFDLGVIAGDRALDPVFPRLVLSRPNDGKVSVAATKIAGMRDHITLPVSHTFMVNAPGVAHQMLAFLREGRFDHP